MTTRNNARRRKGSVRQTKYPGWDEARRGEQSADREEAEQRIYGDEALATRNYWKDALGVQASFVYAIRSVGQAPVKIGHTAGDPLKRVAELQCGNPADIYIAGLILGSKKTERDLHRYWASAHVRGEWFGNGCEHAIVELFDVVALMQMSDYEDGSDAMYVRDETPVAVLRQAIRAEAA